MKLETYYLSREENISYSALIYAVFKKEPVFIAPGCDLSCIRDDSVVIIMPDYPAFEECKSELGSSNTYIIKYIEENLINPIRMNKTLIISTPVCFSTLFKAIDILGIKKRRKKKQIDEFYWGKTDAMKELKNLADRSIKGECSIHITGEMGSGKTMLAKCFPTILPDLTFEEALEVTKIHSVAGTLDAREGIVCRRPFRSPHHTATLVSLTGGGRHAKPGEISLAHNGVLFLDEMPEYNRSAIEALRQPLEDGVITVARAELTVTYPANFTLIASMNPCPCGHYGSKDAECKCTQSQIHKYLGKLSGPLMDRIDLHIEVDNVTYENITDANGDQITL